VLDEAGDVRLVLDQQHAREHVTTVNTAGFFLVSPLLNVRNGRDTAGRRAAATAAADVTPM
jgi:hypothetical protein